MQTPTPQPTPSDDPRFSLDSLDYAQAATLLMLASAIGHILSDDAAAAIVANAPMALDLVLVDAGVERQIDELLSGPPIRWTDLSITRRWAGIFGAQAVAQALSTAAFQELVQSIPPAQRSSWVRAISPKLVRS